MPELLACPDCQAPYGAAIVRPSRAPWLWFHNTDSIVRRFRGPDGRDLRIWCETVEARDEAGRCLWCKGRAEWAAMLADMDARRAEEAAREARLAPQREKARQRREERRKSEPVTTKRTRGRWIDPSPINTGLFALPPAPGSGGPG